MDLELLTPFGIDIPESVTATLDDYASCARYSPSGRLIAAGRLDGWGTIWDLDTQGVLRSLEGHSKAVTSVSWSRNSRYVLTSSRDWNCIVWDLEEADRVETIRFPIPVKWSCFHPRTSKIFIAILSSGRGFIIDMRHDEIRREELVHSSSVDAKLENDAEGEAGSSETKIEIATFTPDGLEVFAGTASGELLIFRLRSKLLIHREHLTGNSAIRHLSLDPSGRYLATASSDRGVRIYRINRTLEGIELEMLHTLRDNVARVPWNGITWNKDGAYIVGGSGHKASHTIYIWDRDTGRLEKILEGPRDPLTDVDWHPIQPALLSVNSRGGIHLWSIVSAEKWGAFAAGFEELEENIIYEEKEDEFDIEDEAAAKRRKDEQEDEDVDVVDHGYETAARPPLSHSASMVDHVVDDRQRLEDLAWLDEDPDDDTVPYFPPVFPEPPEGYME